MQICHLLITLFLCILPSVEIVNASGPEKKISFLKARELILSENPGLKSSETLIEAAKEGVLQADVQPNPSVDYSLDKLGANEIEITIEQSIELGGKRKYRKEAAEREVELALNSCDYTRLELEAEILRRFIPVITVQKKLALLDSMIDIAEITREEIKRRFEEGARRKTDLVRAEIDIEQLKLEHSELESDAIVSRKKFASLGAKSQKLLMNVTGTISENIEIPTLEEIRERLQLNLLLKAVDIEQQQFETFQRQLGAEAIPDLNVYAGYLRDNKEKSNSPLVGLSMTIPIFNRNKAAQRQVWLKGQALQQKRQNLLSIIDADAQEIHSRLLAIENQIKMLTTSIIPKSENVYTMMQEYYSSGNVEYLDLSETQAEVLRSIMKLYDIQAEMAQKLTDLMQISNIPLQIVKSEE
ncbi:MAG TPA: TolC family protein [Chitinispirillaceae bacterium]|nr:TolC family protein [Chitinispirillaceae bacterium]